MWAYICRYFISTGEWGGGGGGGPDANTDRGKQSICAVMASGGFPGNGYFRTDRRMHMLICVTILILVNINTYQTLCYGTP